VARRIAELRGAAAADDELRARAPGSAGAGTGGMASKLAAARVAAEGGVAVLITSGHNPRVLAQALAGDDIGTFVAPTSTRTAHRRAIAVAARVAGALVINEGALQALRSQKASLLPVGVIEVVGEFTPGEVVELRDASGRGHGRGLVNYEAAACRALMGRQSHEIAELLGWRGYDTLVSRENLVLSGV
jgi:glutamate 5-kinase